MRSSKSRSRSKSNRGNNRSPANNINRVFDSSGPEGKVRGTPQQIIDKYNQLARDAQLSNDRVAAENFQQHAEHYTRLLAEAQRDVEESRQRAEQQARERQQAQQAQQAQQQAAQQKRERERQDNGPAEDLPGFITAPAGSEGASDVVEAVGGGESGLVETPESAPKKKPAPRTRKPRTRKPAADPARAEQPDAEPAPQPEPSAGDSSDAAAE